MRPLDRRLGPHTWYYLKRCFLSLQEKIAKQLIILKDEYMKEIIDFLEACDRHGKNIKADYDVEENENANTISK